MVGTEKGKNSKHNFKKIKYKQKKQIGRTTLDIITK